MRSSDLQPPGGSLLALLGALAVASPARADDLPVKPMLFTELDANAHPEAAEGQNGFSFTRFRPGLWARPTDWAFVLGSIELAAPETPTILDGFVTVVPIPQLRLTAGYSKSPLFVSARSELEGTTPMPELSMPVRALWPGRDLGVEAQWVPRSVPLEAWVRLGNGVSSPIGKQVTDAATFGYTVRLDAAAGRGRFEASPAQTLGLRVGVGAFFDDVEDQAGITGRTESGYAWFQPPTIQGHRSVVEGHVLAYAGPFRALVEAGAAFENRSTGVTGASGGARLALDPVATRGESAELAWMLTGQRRMLGAWPVRAQNKIFEPKNLGVEGAVRLERLDVGRGARDVAPSGSTSSSASLTCWLSDVMSLAVAGYVYSYDAAPIDEPARTSSWLVQSRFTVYLNPPPPPRWQTKQDRKHD